MKNLIIYPEQYKNLTKEFLLYREPLFLHCVVYLMLLLCISAGIFLCFGRMEETVRASGIVRPEENISSVKNAVSGKVLKVFYKPGGFVEKNEKLLVIKPDSLLSERSVLESSLKEAEKKIKGNSLIIKAFENNQETVYGAPDFSKAKYEAFIAQKKLLSAKTERAEELYEKEISLPENCTTKNNIEERLYEKNLCSLEENGFLKNFISEVRNEYDSLLLEKENLKENLVQLDLSMENFEIISPVSGYVQEISSLNEGDFIFQDQKLLNIVPPSSSKMRIELSVPAEKMGKLKKGQKIKLRFPAFPFYEYKGLEGTLSVIQPDSEINQNGAVYFKIWADVDSFTLKNRKNIEYEIKPGFEVDARIVLENQTVLYFLLKKLDLTV